MRKSTLLVTLLWSWGRSSAGQVTDPPSGVTDPQTEPQEDSPELAAIRAEAEVFRKAFQSGDAKAIASLWTEDGEYIDPSGERLAGRAAIEKGYTDFFAAHPGTEMKITIDSLRLVGPNTAIEDGRVALQPAPEDGAGASTTRQST